MHKDFDPQKFDWKELLVIQHQPPSQWGGGGITAVFRGMPLQRGMGLGGMFRSLLRFLMPIGREAAVAIGRQGLETGMRTLNDVLEGRNLQEAAIEHGRAGAKQLLQRARTRLETKEEAGKQDGGGKKHINKIGRYNPATTTVNTVKTTQKLKKKTAKSLPKKKLKRDALGFY